MLFARKHRRGIWHLVVAALAAGLVLWCRSRGLHPEARVTFFSFVGAWITVPLVWRGWAGLGGVSLPGGRRLHGERIPLVGGFAVFLPIVLSLAEFAWSGGGDPQALALASGCALLFAMGLWDDLRGMRARTKLAIQCVAALLLIIAEFSVTDVGAPGMGSGTLHLGWWGVPLSLLWVVLITNAFNLIDGMDGQACVLVLVACVGLLWRGSDHYVVAALAGSVLGFLGYNLPPARAFLGDAGSLVLGYVVAALCLRLPINVNAPVALGIVAFPLFDTVLAIARRSARGSPLFAADRSHMHHKLLALFGGDRLRALGAVVVIAAVPLGLAMWRPGFTSVFVSALFFAALIVLLLRTTQRSVSSVVKGRRGQRRMYLVQSYVMGGLRLARTRQDVAHYLRRLVEDLPLAAVDVGGLRLENPEVPGTAEEEEVPLLKGVARWRPLVGHETEPYSDRVARQSIVCDALRRAQGCLDQFDRESRA